MIINDGELGALDLATMLPIAVGVLEQTQPKDQETAETIDLMRQVLELEQQPGGLLDPTDTAPFEVKTLRRPLQAYLFARQHPTLAAALPLLAIAGAVAGAYFIGRRVR